MKSIISDIKIFIVDCDGCLTDGFMYYTDEGQYMKKFNAKDGMGLMQVKRNGIKTGIVTGDTHLIAQKRAEHLNLDFVESGIKAILNYAPMKPVLPKKIVCRNIDPVLSLQSMSYYLNK